MKMPIRFGVIGVGTMGYAHADYLRNSKVDGAVLAALCDQNLGRLEELKNIFPNVPCFLDSDELLKSGLCDAVIIATPHYDHSLIGIRAFECGLHILSEKPMAVQLSEAYAFAKAADQSGKAFCVMFNQRTNPVFAKARELVQSGFLGELKRINWIITNWYRTQHYYDSGDWRASWSGEGGGVLMNQAPHNLDLLQWICGMPKRIMAKCDVGKYHQIEVEDEALLIGEYENGATLLFHTSTGEFPGTNRLEIAGDRGKIVMEKGILKFWRLHESERSFCFSSKKSFDKISMEYEEMRFNVKGSAHGKILQNFVDHIISDEPLISDGRDAINEVVLSNAAYLSSWEDEWINLPGDSSLFDSYLQQLKQSSTKRNFEKEFKNEGYQERWQVRW